MLGFLLRTAPHSSMIYILLMMLIATKYIVDLDRYIVGIYRYSIDLQVAFALYISIILFITRDRLIAEFKHGFGQKVVLVFLAYVAIQTFAYPDWSVASPLLGGVVFHICGGLILGYLAFSRFDSGSVPTNRGQLVEIAVTVIVFWLCVISVFVILSDYILDEYFLIYIPNVRVSYQTVGSYSIVVLMLFVHMVSGQRGENFRSGVARAAIWTAQIGAASSALFFLNQLLGSNNAAAMVALIGAGSAAYGLVGSWKSRDKVRHLRSGAIAGVAGMVFVVVVGIASSIPPMRIFGFQSIDPLANVEARLAALSDKLKFTEGPRESVGDASIRAGDTERTDAGAPESQQDGGDIKIAPSSLDSRRVIFKETALQQITFAPLLGDIGVDRKIGRPGDYLHSILSIQTHLGLVGSMLFLAILIPAVWRIYAVSDVFVLKIVMPPVLVMAAIATFFTWMPLWFVIGASFARSAAPRSAVTDQSATAAAAHEGGAA